MRAASRRCALTAASARLPRAAVRAYQRFAGLTVDGVVGRTTWNSLYGKAPACCASSGPVVTLKRLPYPGTPLTVGSHR
ncbi:MAG: peptidoglycan-binding domain-containing protein [Faecalibacterium prausnitzii]